MQEKENQINAEERLDIFDRLMRLPLLRILLPLYTKYKSILLYLFFGVVTTAVNFVVFLVLRRAFGVDELSANLVAWIVAVLVAFFTNRSYVFASTEQDRRKLFEFFRFVGSRVSTLLLEEAAIFVFVTWLSYYDVAVKAIVAVAVVILNYIFSRFLVFRKQKSQK